MDKQTIEKCNLTLWMLSVHYNEEKVSITQMMKLNIVHLEDTIKNKKQHFFYSRAITQLKNRVLSNQGQLWQVVY